MADGGSRSFMGILLAIVSFIIAILMFTARVLPDDPTARTILGFLFIGIGILWIIRYAQQGSKRE